jgi:hypothetical protein
MTATIRILRWLVGHKHDTRYKWGELAWHFRYPKLKLEYCPAGMFSHNTLIFAPLFFSLYLHLPTRRHGDGCMRDKEPSYGFYTIDTSIVWRWNLFYKSWGWPWFSCEHYSTEVLTLDRQATVHIEYSRRAKKGLTAPDWHKEFEASQRAKKEHCAVYSYSYQLRNGTVQELTAKVSVDRRTWTRKWFPWAKIVQTCIDVQFSEEVGERAGSWKGGCTGCGYEMLPGETVIQCLRRMERDRKF